eukprot:6141970-Pyramimonas_sp.AAC.1
MGGENGPGEAMASSSRARLRAERRRMPPVEGRSPPEAAGGPGRGGPAGGTGKAGSGPGGSGGPSTR